MEYPLIKLDTKLVLFKAKQLYQELSWADHPSNYWQDYSIYPIEIHHIPGNHETMFKEPNVQILADEIKNCLSNIK
ncbi:MULTISPECIES: hypothetical protein [Legionella]|uniref:Peptide synthetase, non-ribosomal n=1 Tax=Legionella maceachernii TaxID=466 RepID=A0A0W0WD65_9GAMM|nr:hypothetical protein [Legionella maceachernii]KTD30248.1 peptide synthetase, non-ribosomal [Legionella maceachernii]SJZ51446.1 hypothetical protein SAMN02745128_00324 [Legionella maceachernii]SUP03682.1 Uncharacterised protein [Legionella maceachernii]